MQHRRWLAAALVATSLSVSACAGTANLGEASSEEAGQVEPIEGTDLSQVILTAEAAERLGIKTEPVRAIPGAPGAAGAAHATVQAAAATSTAEVIPYAAVLYDEEGNTSTYTSTEPLTFVRRPITVDHIDGDRALLRAGPAAGTAVVTVGAAELLGVEYGVEGE